MVLSLWRYAHLALALISSVFLVILAATGVILAVGAVNDKLPAYQIDEADTLNLAQVVPNLHKVYPEIITLSRDHRGFVSIDAIDEEGNPIKGYINPYNGEKIGEITQQSPFIQWTTALHRSLFLKETGRVIVAVVSFLLVLISISGLVLILKRQQGFKNFFAKVQKDFFSQYFHVVTGRLALIPVLIIAITGTYLFLLRMELFQGEAVVEQVSAGNSEDMEEAASLSPADFPIFKSIPLERLESIEFPFIPDDPEEFYIVKLQDEELHINQISGQIVERTIFPSNKWQERWNMDIHTGRTNIVWAIVLGLASLNILAFIYTGFVITLKRSRTKIRNKFKPLDAETVILYGSENGSTLFFANKIQEQLLAAGEKSYLAAMNQYGTFPKANKILILTSTYGLGDAPSNAGKFLELLQSVPQDQSIAYTVLGFGSKAYPDYCAYAIEVDNALKALPWAKEYLPLHTVNDKAIDELIPWLQAFSDKSLLPLATAAAVYAEKPTKMQEWKVLEKTSISASNDTFKVILEPIKNQRYTSGDLFAIYPGNDHRERFYSIGKCGGKLQLIVKKHEQGLGSTYLHDLAVHDVIKAKAMRNAIFHFPRKAKEVALIFNGTGIAPFLGMIAENSKRTPIYCYGGFRYQNDWVNQYVRFAEEQMSKNHLVDYQFAYSRQEPGHYVMDLIAKDKLRFAKLLARGGVIMICGSLAMQRDVENLLDKICLEENNRPLSYYQKKQQLMTDCY